LPRNPCPFGDQDSHLALLLLLPGSAILIGPLDLTAQLPSNQYASLPVTPYDVLRGIGSWLEPRPFSGPTTSASELLRFPWKMAASKPTSLLFLAADAFQFNT